MYLLKNDGRCMIGSQGWILSKKRWILVESEIEVDLIWRREPTIQPLLHPEGPSFGSAIRSGGVVLSAYACQSVILVELDQRE